MSGAGLEGQRHRGCAAAGVERQGRGHLCAALRRTDDRGEGIGGAALVELRELLVEAA